MSKHESKKKLVGPWRSLYVVIWLVGIYLLATNNWWWPGILILVGISALYEGFLQLVAPSAFEQQPSTQAAQPEVLSNPPPVPYVNSAPVQEHRIELLPQVCPSCNAPIRGHEVKWTGTQSANCPYCGTNLPVNKA